MPDSPEYLAKIRAEGGGDFLRRQRESLDAIARLIDGVDDARLARRPAAEKWSVAEIIAHLADDEIATAWRYRQMIENPGVQLAGFDQDVWADIGNYRNSDARKSLALFRALREGNLRLLESLTDEQWEAHGIHAERGKITVRDLARHMAGHDANHIKQIEERLKG